MSASAIGQRFDVRVAIETYQPGADDDYGQPDPSWQLLGWFPAHVRETSEDERAQTNLGGAAVATHVIYLFPTVPLPRTADRIRHSDGRTYDIQGVRPKPDVDHPTFVELDAVLVTA